MPRAHDFDYDAMLAKIKDRQWALADIDWDAPGADAVTDEQRPRLKEFMADLVWIENVGARGFAALAGKAPTPVLREIYTYFHAEEQRHANAELALMRRWGMLEDDEVPEPNINVRLAIEWLDRWSDDMSLAVLGTVIPMLEVALDGALLKFLLDEVHDPVCHRVFDKINADESRHLAVDFQVLDLLGHAPARRLLISTVGTVARPTVLLGALMYVPLLNRMRDNIVAMGLDERRLYTAMSRFTRVGERSPATRRLPSYQILKRHAAIVIDRGHPYHHFADFMVKASARYPRRLLRPTPSWARELTHEPVAR
ncbi:reductase [Actinomadura hibisca]|uniref:reductase n=1 Tax=Actinomadura hibisca TaxID=68565 RepID=UPI000835C446|nr:reductase [Actinomadura hibisca]